MKRKALEILCVEDNPGDRRLIAEFLRSHEFHSEIQFAKDGEEALNLLRNCLECPDLVMLDLNIPKVDGKEVLREIKSAPGLKHIPVIIFSSSADPDDVSETLDLHANCYLVKPTDLSTFQEVMDKIEQFWLETTELYPQRRLA